MTNEILIYLKGKPEAEIIEPFICMDVCDNGHILSVCNGYSEYKYQISDIIKIEFKGIKE